MQQVKASSTGRMQHGWIAAFVVVGLLVTGCTHYRPLDRGAKVPWAKALSSSQGGQIGDDRYRVGKGDSLSRIAHRYGVRMRTLAAANNIDEPYVLYPGEVLRIPPDAPMPSRRPEPPTTSRIAEAELAPVDEKSARAASNSQARQAEIESAARRGKRHVVASGESLSIIAARHGLRIGDLVASNDIEPPYEIAAGQTLFIPISEREFSDARRPASERSSASMDPPPPLSREGFLWPVNGDLIGNFEENRANGRSGGVTIAARKGTPVRAADNGVVAYAGEALSGYGRMVMVRHAEGYVTLYAHNERLRVREGDIVRRGETIAEVGDSGDVRESQLHFELRKGTAPIDPAGVLAGLPGRQIGRL